MWLGSQGVKNSPVLQDGNYFKLGDMIIASSGWDSQAYINRKWGSSWGSWITITA